MYGVILIVVGRVNLIFNFKRNLSKSIKKITFYMELYTKEAILPYK